MMFYQTLATLIIHGCYSCGFTAGCVVCFFCCFFFVKFSVSLLIRIILNELYMVHCGCYCGNSL